MTQTARVFTNGNSQAVRLPKDFRLPSGPVFIRKDVVTGDIVISTRPESGTWADFLALRARTKGAGDFLAERTLNQTAPLRDALEAAAETPLRSQRD
jgi:antitoxin VapB